MRMWSCAENAHNVACPKNGKTFILEIRISQKGTCDRRFSPKMAQKCINIWIDVPFLDFLIFKINETPFLGHAQTPKNAGFWPKMSHFSARWFLPHFNTVLKMTALWWRRACSKKSSAIYLVRVEFSQKYFVDLIFGHRFLSIFSKFFRLLCKVESKNNNF